MLHRPVARILARTSLRRFSLLTEYTTESVGEGFDRRIFILKDGEKVSPWHGIPLNPTLKMNVVNCVFEIGNQDTPKMEVVTDEKHNPIKQDILKRDGTERLREYGVPAIFNYGMLPLTWESPKVQDPKYGYSVS